jgi:hypothetical protein
LLPLVRDLACEALPAALLCERPLNLM